jgi:small GTP-binding protein
MSRIKAALIGDAQVGKTQLLQWFTRRSFSSFYKSTMGVDFSTRDMDINGQQVNLQTWDIAGQQRYEALASIYFRDTDVLIIAFDLTNPQSFEHIEDHLKKFQAESGKLPPLLIVGTKSDLTDQRVVKQESIDSLITRINHTYQTSPVYFETSSKENINIDVMFQKACDLAIKKIPKQEDTREDTTSDTQAEISEYTAVKYILVKIFTDYKIHLAAEDKNLRNYDAWLDDNMRFINNSLSIKKTNTGLRDQLSFISSLLKEKIKSTNKIPIARHDHSVNADAPSTIKTAAAINELQSVLSFYKRYNPPLLTTEKKAIDRLQQMLPTLQGATKLFSAKELVGSLNNDTNPSDAINKFNELLPAYDPVFNYNRQSTLEKGLKIAAVISILIGVGIIPTIVLAAKRLYDSGGKSVNFFQPLSVQIRDKATATTNTLRRR